MYKLGDVLIEWQNAIIRMDFTQYLNTKFIPYYDSNLVFRGYTRN